MMFDISDHALTLGLARRDYIYVYSDRSLLNLEHRNNVCKNLLLSSATDLFRLSYNPERVLVKNPLTTLPADVFSGLGSLTSL